MTITFYTITDEANVLNKTLGTGTDYTISARSDGGIDTENPVVDIASDSELTYNYAYIAEYHKYYFVAPPVKVRTGYYRYALTVDVLQTYQDDIRELTGIVERSSNVYNAYLTDNKFRSLNYRQIVAKSFPNGVNDDTFILMTIG